MMYKEFGQFEDNETCKVAAFAALDAMEVFEEYQLLTVVL